MLLGSLDICIKNNKYYINNIDNIDNITRLLLQSFQLEENEFSSIFSLMSLKEYIAVNNFNVETIHIFIKSLYDQIEFFKETNHSISFIDISDILVINKNRFLFCNSEKILQIKNKKILITQLYDKENIFIPPEFITNDTIPFYVYQSSFYYSIGVIVLYCFQQQQQQQQQQQGQEQQGQEQQQPFDKILQQFEYSNFYFTISSCFNTDPSKRVFIVF
jgi:hypothetical protein